MDFGFTKEQELFRQEVRGFIKEELKQGNFVPAPGNWSEGHSREFAKKLGNKGWIGLFWPKEYGGEERSEVDRLIFYEEMLRFGAPIADTYQAEGLFATMILLRGSEEQKAKILPRIKSGDIIFASVTNEPEGNGIDGSIKTRAVLDGDEWVINGQKLWSTHAPHANVFVVQVITDPGVVPTGNFNKIIVDPSTPGITLRPLTIMSGHVTFGEEFFDDVRVPRGNIIPGKISKQEERLLATEHGHTDRILCGYPLWEATLKFLKETKVDGKPLAEDPIIRSKVAQIEMEREIGRLFDYAVGVTRDKGGDLKSSGEYFMCKAYGAEFEEHEANTIMDILGLYGQLWSIPGLGPVMETATRYYMYSKTSTLRSYPSEALWCRVAMEGLGLPSYLEPPLKKAR